LEEDFGMKIGQTTLVRWKKKYHIPSQTENLQPQWDATKKLVLASAVLNKCGACKETTGSKLGELHLNVGKTHTSNSPKKKAVKLPFFCYSRG